MWLNIRTEFSFGNVYGHIKEVIQKAKNNNAKAVGITDFNNTFGHVPFEKECLEQGIKPVFGVILPVVERLDIKERRLPFDEFHFIALTDKGLQQIYRMVDVAHQQFYYKPRVTYKQINGLSEKHVAMIASYSPRFDLLKRKVYLKLSPDTPLAIRNLKNVDYLACCDNYFPNKEDKLIYEPFANERTRERKTTAMHILTQKEWSKTLPNVPKSIKEQAIKNRDKVLKKAKANIKKAMMVKFDTSNTIEQACIKGAKKRGINIKKGVYKKRYEKELKLIKSKGYEDYFFIVADLIQEAKKKSLVGHARGSSAGSLICYLMFITEVNPIKYDLIFERFIDINREDLPDIDIDIQKNRRQESIRYLQKKYGSKCVAQIANISRLKPRSAIARISKAFSIPPWETEELKESIEERESSHVRANKSIEDSFSDTTIGNSFINLFPQMKVTKDVEGHASHSSVHAAGIIVSNNEITDFCGINSRDKERIAMIDKDDAEEKNLLKIDLLGLRTLDVLEEVLRAINKPNEWLYSLPLDDKKTFKTINKQRLTGLFQFEGDSIRKIAKRMIVENIFDISILVSICRPAPMIAGSTEKYIQRKSGEEKVEYIGDDKRFKKITKETLGLVIYQEQVMQVLREYAGFSWKDTSILRKAMAKSKGDQAFKDYKKRFVKGAIKKGSSEKVALEVWSTIESMGKYSFNKSHAISYSMITYLCAYLKTHYPLEFAVATLNNEKDVKSSIKLLRELNENEGIKHIPFDPDKSEKSWTIYNGKLLGSLLSVEGIAAVSANKILLARKKGLGLPDGIKKHVDNAFSPYEYIYPAEQIYGDYYSNPMNYGIIDTRIKQIKKLIHEDEVCIIGMLTRKNIRDMNETSLVQKRKGKIIEGSSTFLSLSFEDDTGSVYGTIGYKDFPEIGVEIAEEGKVDKDWFLIFGKYNSEFNSIYIYNIETITRNIRNE